MVLISQMIRAMKKHKILAACMTCMLAAGGLFVTSCEDIEPIHELDLARVLSPTGLNVTISAKVNIEISWEALDEKAESYVLEVYKGETATEEALHTRAENLTTTSYRLENMGYEETYLIRVKAVGQDVEDSKWTEVVTKTDSEQIFSTVQSEDINGNSVTLRWPAGEAADQITITPVGAEDAEVTITLTPDDVANGYVTVSGLEYETDYTAVMTLGDKTRGTITFKTGIDLSKAQPLNADLTEKEIEAFFANAANGSVISLVPGASGTNTFPTLEISLTKSCKIIGLSDQPVTCGFSFKVEGASDVTLQDLTFDGGTDSKTLVSYVTTVEGGNLTISNCSISGYKKILDENNAEEMAARTLTIENNMITGSLERTIDFQKKKINFATVNISKNTFYNITGKDLFRFDYVAGRKDAVYTIENNTFYNVATTDKGILYIRSNSSSTIEFTCNVNKNIFAYSEPNADVHFSEDSKTNGVTFADNYYYNGGALLENAEGDTSGKVFDTGTSLDNMPFADAENADFSVTDQTLIDAQVGDPRWLQ